MQFRMTRMERDSPPGQPEEQHGKLVEERSKPLQLVSRLDMVHYLNVTGRWDEDLRECCFERAVSQRALAIKNLEDLRRHLRVQQPRCIPAADPKQQQHHAMSPQPAIVTELGGSRQGEIDNFASMLVQVLGVKESADLKEGFGFFVQQLLSGGLEMAHAQGRGRGGGKAAEKVHGKGKGMRLAEEKAVEKTYGGAKGMCEASHRREDGRHGEEEAGSKVEMDGVVGVWGRARKDVKWRAHLKGRVWERYVDGMKWILEHDVDFLVGFAGYVMHPPACTQCSTCSAEFMQSVCIVALIVNFAYRPVSHLLSRVLSVFPPSSPGFDKLVECLDLPARLPRPVNLQMLLRQAEQVPLYFLIHMAVWCARPLLNLDCSEGGYNEKGQGVKSGARKKEVAEMGKGGRVKLQGCWDGEMDQPNGGEVWEEVEIWYFATMKKWMSKLRVEGGSEECSGSRELERPTGGFDITWALAAAIIPRCCEGLQGQQRSAMGSSNKGSSSSGGCEKKGKMGRSRGI
ncbi:unnamed protein product [Closterium sp. NIES-65]|nr:unnamed protein product [Closterium sp. NIES-65]